MRIKQVRIKGYAVCQDDGDGFKPVVICFDGKDGATLTKENLKKGRTKIAECTIILKNLNG